MARISSFAPIAQNGLLGFSNPYGERMTSLLGLDPSEMRRQALSSGLAQAGFTLMGTTNYGDVGSAFLQGANSARDDYMRNALVEHQMRTAAEERDYARSRDAESDRRWQMQWDYNAGRDQQADAWTNTQNQRTLEDWQRQDDLRQGQQTAVEDWTGNFAQQGGTLPFSPEVRGIARQGGLDGVSSTDMQRYGRMQPFVQAGDYGGAFSQMTAASEPTKGVEVGGKLVDPYTGQVIYESAPDQMDEVNYKIRQLEYLRMLEPDPRRNLEMRKLEAEISQLENPQVKPTDDMRELDAINAQRQAAGMAPLRLDEWLTTKSKAGAPQTNIGLEGDSYAKERGKAFAGSMGEYEAAEKSAFDTLASIDVMQNVMQDPSFYSGWGGQIALNAKQFLSTMGGDPNAAASMETFNAESKRMALANMGGSLGTGFSNADRDFVNYQVANLDTSMQGNQSLLEINRRVAERKIQIAQMARDYEIKNGRIDARFRQELSRWALANPLFPEAEGMNIEQQRPALADPLGIR